MNFGLPVAQLINKLMPSELNDWMHELKTMTDFEDAQCLLQNFVELNTGSAKWLYTDLNQNGQTQYSDGQQTVLSYIEYKGTFLQHMARLRKRYSECNIQV